MVLVSDVSKTFFEACGLSTTRWFGFARRILKLLLGLKFTYFAELIVCQMDL